MEAIRVFFTKQRNESTIVKEIDNVTTPKDVDKIIRWTKASDLPPSSIEKIAKGLNDRVGHKFPTETVNKIRNLNLNARKISR